MKAKDKLFFLECNIAGRQYYDATDVWKELEIGTELILRHEEENRYDENAVAIYYRRPSDQEEFQLGYIPQDDNESISRLLQMGYDDIFETRLSRIVPEAHYAQQLHVIVRVKRRNKDN